MKYQTLYRKYRPKQFRYVYGQDTIVKTLKNTIKNEKINHAYLFTGPKGTGKTSCAKLFAKTINCLNNKDGDACNECSNCISFNENSNPDIIEIDAASNNGVDEIREIRSKVNLAPAVSKYKIYIIDEVHMLSIGAFNALLKTLEEPPNHIIFILATTEPQKLPNTVISRCQRYDFKNINEHSMRECLKRICDLEKINITDDSLDLIINNSNGGMRDAIGMLDQAYIYSDKQINKEDLESLLGTITDEDVLNVFKCLLKKDYKGIIDIIDEFDKENKDFLLINKKMLNFAYKGIVYKKTLESKKVTEQEIDFFEKISDTNLYNIIDSLNSMIEEIKNSYQKRIVFEVNMFKLIDKMFKKNSISYLDDKDLNNKNNVSRETLSGKELKMESNVPRETLRENEEESLLKSNIEKIKDVRINNILKESSKNNIKLVLEGWKMISNYLTDESYKIVAGILTDSIPVAASSNGIIITLPVDSSVNKIEKLYDLSKKMLEEIFKNKYKIVYITGDYWKKIRPIYVEKAKKNELKLESEEGLLNKIKEELKQNSVNDFCDLIEMEEN